MPDYEFPPDVSTVPFHEEVTAVYAARGAGKTYKAQRLVEENAPDIVVWIDPTQNKEANLDDLRASIVAGDKITLFAASHPKIAQAALMVCYRLSTKSRRVFVVCDEAADYLSKQNEHMRQVFHKGRHRGLGILLVSQRPSGIHPDFRSQAAQNYWGRLGPNDINVARSYLSPADANSRATAGQGDFLTNAV